MTDFRALCAELLADYELNRFRAELAAEARAALAEGDGVGASGAALRVAHYLEQRRLMRGLDPEVIHSLHAGTDEPRQAALTVIDLEALACTANPRPISVAERMPTEADCIPHPRTSLGRWCWGFERSEVSLARPARWRLMHMETTEFEASHWLPAAAIPMPEASP